MQDAETATYVLNMWPKGLGADHQQKFTLSAGQSKILETADGQPFELAPDNDLRYGVNTPDPADPANLKDRPLVKWRIQTGPNLQMRPIYTDRPGTMHEQADGSPSSRVYEGKAAGFHANREVEAYRVPCTASGAQIKLDGKVIADGNTLTPTTVVAGEPHTLEGSCPAGQAAEWHIPQTRQGGEGVGNASTTPQPLVIGGLSPRFDSLVSPQLAKADLPTTPTTRPSAPAKVFFWKIGALKEFGLSCYVGDQVKSTVSPDLTVQGPRATLVARIGEPGAHPADNGKVVLDTSPVQGEPTGVVISGCSSKNSDGSTPDENSFFFIQTLGPQEELQITTAGTQLPERADRGGLDGGDGYTPSHYVDGLVLTDDPGFYVFEPNTTNPLKLRASRHFTATSTLMWTSTAAGSIPVPVALMNWRVDILGNSEDGKKWNGSGTTTPSGTSSGPEVEYPSWLPMPKPAHIKVQNYKCFP